MRRTQVAAVCLLAALPVFAADGTTPIWAPTIITQPGSYVVTQDIIDIGSIITVASNNVTLDLNGFTVESTNGSAIDIVSFHRGVTIMDGTIIGAAFGVNLPDGTNVVISHNRIESSNGHGIYIGDGNGHVVHRNVLHIGANAAAAIRVDANNTEISENTITCTNIGNFSDGITTGFSGDNLIRDNRIRDCAFRGIEVGSRSLVRNNAVSGEVFASYGIEVAGDYNHIEGNLVTNNWKGLFFGGDNNVYRRNTARGSLSADFQDSGVNNTSHGDNYMPNQM